MGNFYHFFPCIFVTFKWKKNFNQWELRFGAFFSVARSRFIARLQYRNPSSKTSLFIGYHIISCVFFFRNNNNIFLCWTFVVVLNYICFDKPLKTHMLESILQNHMLGFLLVIFSSSSYYYYFVVVVVVDDEWWSASPWSSTSAICPFDCLWSFFLISTTYNEIRESKLNSLCMCIIFFHYISSTK